MKSAMSSGGERLCRVCIRFLASSGKASTSDECHFQPRPVDDRCRWVSCLGDQRRRNRQCGAVERSTQCFHHLLARCRVHYMNRLAEIARERHGIEGGDNVYHRQCASYQLANAAAYASERIEESLKSIGESIRLNSIMAMSPCNENRYRTTIQGALGDTPEKQMANATCAPCAHDQQLCACAGNGSEEIA